MKNFLKLNLLIATIILLFSCHIEPDDNRPETLKFVNGKKVSCTLTDRIQCASCIGLIEDILKRLDGVFYAEVNISDKSIHIIYNDKKIDLEQIKTALRKNKINGHKYEIKTCVDR